MEKFILSTDSCCDQPKEFLKDDNIFYISMSFSNNEDIFFDNFQKTEEYESFYDRLKNGEAFSTAGINPYDIKEYFEKIIDEKKKDIVHVCLSSGLSGTFEHVKNTADEINKNSKYKVYVVDSLSATQGQNYLLQQAKKLLEAGKSAKFTYENITEMAKKLVVCFFLSDLETLKKGGRISPAQAMIGKIVQLRPLLAFNKEGKLEVKEKIIGSKKAILSLYNKCKENFDKNYPVFFAYAGSKENVNELENLVKTNLTENTFVGPVGPVICSHTGPCLTGIIFLSK